MMKFQRVKPKSQSRVLRFNALVVAFALALIVAMDTDSSFRHFITVDVCLVLIVVFAAINFVMRLDTKHYLVSALEQEILFPDSHIESEKGPRSPSERS